MKIVSKNSKSNNFPKTIIILTLFFTIQFLFIYINSSNQAEIETNWSDKSILSFTYDPANDTTAPIITFIQPAVNFTRIKQYSYNFIVNITDDNPPLYGNVTIQISNQTHFLYNASMNYDGGRQWSYNWDNISLYPNYNYYLVRIWAKDSSPNENYSWSDIFYISLSISTGPSFFHFLLYVLTISVIFSLIIVYMNKKARYRVSRKKKKNSEVIYEY